MILTISLTMLRGPKPNVCTLKSILWSWLP